VASSPFEVLVFQWREGARRLRDAPPAERPTLERVVDAVGADLRRRLGGPFTSAELAALYEQGTSWCTDVAYRVAPDAPYAWDPRLVADAAFGRYLRSASDYAGGRRLTDG
jgi:hypothetical protein